MRSAADEAEWIGRILAVVAEHAEARTAKARQARSDAMLEAFRPRTLPAHVDPIIALTSIIRDASGSERLVLRMGLARALEEACGSAQHHEARNAARIAAACALAAEELGQPRAYLLRTLQNPDRAKTYVTTLRAILIWLLQNLRPAPALTLLTDCAMQPGWSSKLAWAALQSCERTGGRLMAEILHGLHVQIAEYLDSLNPLIAAGLLRTTIDRIGPTEFCSVLCGLDVEKAQNFLAVLFRTTGVLNVDLPDLLAPSRMEVVGDDGYFIYFGDKACPMPKMGRPGDAIAWQRKARRLAEGRPLLKLVMNG